MFTTRTLLHEGEAGHVEVKPARLSAPLAPRELWVDVLEEEQLLATDDGAHPLGKALLQLSLLAVPALAISLSSAPKKIRLQSTSIIARRSSEVVGEQSTSPRGRRSH